MFVLMAAQERKLFWRQQKDSLLSLPTFAKEIHSNKKRQGEEMGAHIRWQFEHKQLVLLNCKTQ